MEEKFRKITVTDGEGNVKNIQEYEHNEHGDPIYFKKTVGDKIATEIIYTYEYEPLFPFKVLLQPNENEKEHRLNLHSKIYIIDNKIAYLGSLNFTHYGTKSNHETSIRITDRNALLYINSEFESLLVNDYYQERDLIEWGRSLYDEPIN